MIQGACFFSFSFQTKVFKCPSERDGRWGGFIFGKNFIGCFHLSEHVDHLEIFPLGKTRKLLGWGVPTLPPLFFLAKDQTFSSFSNEGFPNSKSLFRYNFKKSSLIQFNVKIYNRLSHDRNKFSTHKNYFLFLAMLWAPLVIT